MGRWLGPVFATASAMHIGITYNADHQSALEERLLYLLEKEMSVAGSAMYNSAYAAALRGSSVAESADENPNDEQGQQPKAKVKGKAKGKPKAKPEAKPKAKEKAKAKAKAKAQATPEEDMKMEECEEDDDVWDPLAEED